MIKLILENGVLKTNKDTIIDFPDMDINSIKIVDTGLTAYFHTGVDFNLCFYTIQIMNDKIMVHNTNGENYIY